MTLPRGESVGDYYRRFFAVWIFLVIVTGAAGALAGFYAWTVFQKLLEKKDFSELYETAEYLKNTPLKLSDICLIGFSYVLRHTNSIFLRIQY